MLIAPLSFDQWQAGMRVAAAHDHATYIPACQTKQRQHESAVLLQLSGSLSGSQSCAIFQRQALVCCSCMVSACSETTAACIISISGHVLCTIACSQATSAPSESRLMVHCLLIVALTGTVVAWLFATWNERVMQPVPELLLSDV